MTQKFILAIILFLLGLAGVLSLLTLNVPLNIVPEETLELLHEKFTEKEIKLLTLLNPLIMLIVAVAVGTILHKKVNLGAPTIENLITKTSWKDIFLKQLKSGLKGGIIAGVLLLMIAGLFSSFLPEEFIEMGNKLKPNLLYRFLYGGITEEILMRFGLMTFLVWIGKGIAGGLENWVYWMGIILSSILFALGHFPIVFLTVSEPSSVLLLYILLGNSIGGVIYGWLYWKRGLEAAFIAHILTHVILVSGERVTNI